MRFVVHLNFSDTFHSFIIKVLLSKLFPVLITNIHVIEMIKPRSCNFQRITWSKQVLELKLWE